MLLGPTPFQIFKAHLKFNRGPIIKIKLKSIDTLFRTKKDRRRNSGMATKNVSRIHHRHSTAGAEAAAAWYTPPPFPRVEDPDPIVTALSQAIQNAPAKPLHASLKHLLPSLNAKHIINLITLNPLSLSPDSLFSLFQWLSTPGNSTFRHTLHTYCTMIHFLCSHQMFVEAKNLLRIIVSRKGRNSASEVFEAIIEIKGTQKSDLYVFSGLMTAYLESGHALDAIQCFRLAKKHKFRVPFDTCRIVLEHLMKLKSYILVWEFYKEILECGYPASLYFFNILMHKFCKQGEISIAQTVFDSIGRWGLRPSVVSFNTLMNGYVRLGDLNQGFMLKSAMQGNGVWPDVYTYSILLNGLCKERKMDRADELFKEMLDYGLAPNDVTFTTMIDGHCKNERVDLAMDLYKQMMAEGMAPDLITYNVIIDGLCKKGDLKEARDLIDEMSTKGLKPDKVTYSTLINGSCKEGDLEAAFQLKQRMIQENIALDNVVYTTLISGLCQEGRVVDAEKMLREMLRADLKADGETYTMIMDGFCKKGDVRKGSMLLKEMQRGGIAPSVVTYNVLINGYCKLGQMRNANMLLTAMLNLGVVPDDITYNILLEGYCKYRKPDDVLKLRSAKGLVLDYASYTSLIDSLSCVSRIRSKE